MVHMSVPVAGTSAADSADVILGGWWRAYAGSRDGMVEQTAGKMLSGLMLQGC